MTALAEAPAQAEPMILDLGWFERGPTDEMIRTHGWEAFSACGDDPDAMFPEKDDHAGQLESQRICAGCPSKIRGICRREKGDEPFGTVAGETEWDRERRRNRERQRERRARERAV